jgi:hypothetical protein
MAFCTGVQTIVNSKRVRISVASRKSWWLFARAGRWLMTSDELMVCPPGHQPMTDGLMFGPPAIGRWLMLPMVRPHPIGRWSMD